MTIDTTVLFELLKNVAAEADPMLCPEWLIALVRMGLKAFLKTEHEGLQKTAWDATFNIDGLRKRRTFGRQIDTDGVSMTIHFHVTKRHRARHQKRIQRQPDEYNRIISIDPGRVNLVTALDSSTHKIRTLTRNEYYSKARINRLNKKTALWEIPLRGVVSSLSKTSIRTSSPSLTYAYRQVIVRNYDRLWGLRFQKKRAPETLACYVGKQRVMDSFFSSFTTRGELVFYFLNVRITLSVKYIQKQYGSQFNTHSRTLSIVFSLRFINHADIRSMCHAVNEYGPGLNAPHVLKTLSMPGVRAGPLNTLYTWQPPATVTKMPSTTAPRFLRIIHMALPCSLALGIISSAVCARISICRSRMLALCATFPSVDDRHELGEATVATTIRATTTTTPMTRKMEC